jgi:hypothetical protein
MASIDLLSSWLADVDTEPDLRECILDYAREEALYPCWKFAKEWIHISNAWQGPRGQNWVETVHGRDGRERPKGNTGHLLRD